MKNELRARLAYALQRSEDRRMGLRSRLEKIAAEEDQPATRNGDPVTPIHVAAERDKCEQELALAEEWCAATRALVDWLGGELLGDPFPDGHDSHNFYNSPQQPGMQVAPDEMPRSRL